ncbi:MAG: hypothetical protein MUE99_04385 [Chitinophagaceae bacterium]|nr:hypothetical protein [Chitinophagaceae bacterium]
MKNKRDCMQMEVAAFNAMPVYYEKGMYDSIFLLIGYARHFCPDNGVYRMVHNLLMLQYGLPLDTAFTLMDVATLAPETRKTKIYRRTITNHLNADSPRVNLESAQRRFNAPFSHNEWALVGMIQQWASALKPKQPVGSEAALFCSILSGELGGMLRWVYKKPYQSSGLRKAYADYHKKVVTNRALYQEFGLGLSVPGNAYMQELLGNRLTPNYTIGYRSGFNRYDLSMGSRLGNGTNMPYTIKRPDTVFTSTKAYNVQIGLQYARSISKINSRWEWSILGGVMLEVWDQVVSIETLDEEGEEIPERVAAEQKILPYRINGLIPQLGIESKYFTRAGSAVGIVLKYQHIQYFNNQTDVRGPMFLLSLHWATFTLGKGPIR